MSRSTTESWNKAVVKLNDNDDLSLRTTDSTGLNTISIEVPNQDLSLGALDYTTNESGGFKVDYIYFKFSTTINETLIINKITPTMTQELLNEDLTNANNATALALRNVIIKADEDLQIKISNTGGSGIVETDLRIELI